MFISNCLAHVMMHFVNFRGDRGQALRSGTDQLKCMCLLKTTCVCAKSLQSFPDSVQSFGLQPVRLFCPWILQARILEWVTMPSSSGSSQPRIEAASLTSPALAGRFFSTSATWEAHKIGNHRLITWRNCYRGTK